MQKTYNLCMVSHIGNSRTNQEDSFFISPDLIGCADTSAHISREPQCICRTGRPVPAVVAVSDGMGGQASGEVASCLTVMKLSEAAPAMTASPDRATVVSAVSGINRFVQEQSKIRPECRGMGATLCGVILAADGRIVGFNVGDSRLYRYSDGQLKQLSKDHTEGQRLLDLHLLTSEELKSFSNRKAIYKYIGMKTDLVADVFDIMPCENGTILLLCTDGLSDVLADCEIQKILNTDNSLKEKGDQLLKIALERKIGCGDNITIVLTEFRKGKMP